MMVGFIEDLYIPYILSSACQTRPVRHSLNVRSLAWSGQCPLSGPTPTALPAPPPIFTPSDDKRTTPFYFGMHKAQKANKRAPEWSVHCTLVIQYERRSPTAAQPAVAKTKGQHWPTAERPLSPFHIGHQGLMNAFKNLFLLKRLWGERKLHYIVY